MNARHAIVGVLVGAVGCGLVVSMVKGQDQQALSTRPTVTEYDNTIPLRGLKEVGFRIEPQAHAADFVDLKEVERFANHRLERIGLKVVDDARRGKTGATPLLGMRAVVFHDGQPQNQRVFEIMLELVEDSVSLRNPSAVFPGVVWEFGNLGSATPGVFSEYFQRGVDQVMDRFESDFRRANP